MESVLSGSALNAIAERKQIDGNGHVEQVVRQAHEELRQLLHQRSEVMKRIAAPMIGGVVTSAILGLLLYPILYVLWRERRLPEDDSEQASGSSEPTSKVRRRRKVMIASTATGLLVLGFLAFFF